MATTINRAADKVVRADHTTVPTGIGAIVRSAVRQRLDAVEPQLARPEAALVLTMFLLLVTSGGDWYVSIPITVAAMATFVFRDLLHRPNLWFLMGGALLAALNQVWFSADNHRYLFIYWTLAIGLSLYAAKPVASRARAARLLIGLVFLLATFWKAANPEFVSGAFFEHTLLFDGRFDWVTALIGGVDPTVFEQNQQAFSATFGHDPVNSVELVGLTPRVRLFADVLVWWTLFIEGLVALAFLAPRRWAVSVHRDWALITFILTTYVVAPVLGFGWVLAIMGLAQAERRFDGRHVGYFAALVLVELGTGPWGDMVMARLAA